MIGKFFNFYTEITNIFKKFLAEKLFYLDALLWVKFFQNFFDENSADGNIYFFECF